jgi:DNA-binding NarL/FixJ family response regulator
VVLAVPQAEPDSCGTKGRKKGTTKSKPSRAQDLHDKGLRISEIAQALGVSERTILRYLMAALEGTTGHHRYASASATAMG